MKVEVKDWAKPGTEMDLIPSRQCPAQKQNYVLKEKGVKLKEHMVFWPKLMRSQRVILKPKGRG